MRVCAVIDSLAVGGGAERLLASLLPLLRERGIAPMAATLSRSGADYSGELRAAGVPVFDLDLASPKRSPLSGLARLVVLGRREGVQVFWGHLLAGNVYASSAAAMMPGATSVATLHSPGYAKLPPTHWKGRIELSLERALVGSVSGSRVAVSRAVADDYREAFGWRDVRVVHNGVDTGELAPGIEPARRLEVRARLGVPPDGFLVVMPARYVHVKAHDVVIGALRVLRDRGTPMPTIVAPGDGPLRESIVRLARRHDLSTVFVSPGIVDHRQVMDWLRAADVALLASRREPFGIAAAEAMALGVPTILTRVDGFLEIVGDSDSALLVEPDDPDGLADALQRMQSDEGLRSALAARGVARVREEFDIGVCADRWASILRGAAAGLR